MATKTWYLDSKNFGGSTTYVFFTGDESQISTGVNLTNTGWNVGTNNDNTYALLENGNEVSRNTFSSLEPAGPTAATLGETNSTFNNTYNNTTTTIVLENHITLAFPYNAVFENGEPWTLNLDVLADNRSWTGSAQGRLKAQFYKTVFSSAGTASTTQLEDSTNGTNWINSNTITNLTTTAEQTCTINFTPSGIPPAGGGTGFWQIFNGDKTISTASSSGYMSIALMWEVVNGMTGGRNNSCDAMLVTGTNTNSTLVSPPFRKKIYATQ